MRTRVPALMLVAAMLSASGCGGSKSGSGATTSSVAAPSTTATGQTTSSSVASGKPLSASELVAKADAICAQLNRELGKDNIRSREDVLRVVPHRVAIEQAALTELSKLTPPAVIASGYRQILAARRTLIEETTKLGEYTQANNNRAMVPVYKSSVAVARRMALAAHHAGFKDCGRFG
jgi:hypothetical protein